MAKKKSSQKDTKLNQALYAAARSLGWLLPQTEEEVAGTEEPSEPPTPGDAFEALDRAPIFSKRPLADAVAAPEYEAELRRAARLGSDEVPDEIEERMRRDRRKAEEDDDAQ